MEFFGKLFDLLFGGLNDTARWNDLIAYVGTMNIYIVLFLIVFAETGLVVTPILPGDSLIFAIGAIGARQEIHLNVAVVAILLMIASVVGDAVNYWIGYRMGPAIFSKETGRWLNKGHLCRAHDFYEKYGGKTIILARFIPIIRTFAPFVAGIGRMNYFRFAIFNFVGGIAWVLICILAGYYFGQFSVVQNHFEFVIVAIVAVSVLPMAIELWRARQSVRSANGSMFGDKLSR